MALSKSFRPLARLFLAACLELRPAPIRKALEDARAAGATSEEIDETLLLVVPYAGVPRGLNAFYLWREIEPGISAVPPVRDRPAAGARTFAEVYGSGAERIRKEIRGLHPELHDAIIEDAYGRILARSGLEAGDRELIAVPMLIALRALPQAAGHARGALRAGVDRREIIDAVEIAKPYLAPDETIEATKRIVDALL